MRYYAARYPSGYAILLREVLGDSGYEFEVASRHVLPHRLMQDVADQMTRLEATSIAECMLTAVLQELDGDIPKTEERLLHPLAYTLRKEIKKCQQ